MRNNDDGRAALSMQSATPIKRDEVRVIKGILARPMATERLVIARSGTVNGDEDWIINDVKFDGQSQFLDHRHQHAGLPGDLFRGVSAGGAKLEDFVHLAECKEGVEILVTYIGENPNGCVFYAALVGYPIARAVA